MSHTSLSSQLVTALIGIALASAALAGPASAHHGTVPQPDRCHAKSCSTVAQASDQPAWPAARPGSANAPAFPATSAESPNRVNRLYPGIAAALGAGILLILVTRRRSRQARRVEIPAATS